MKLEGNDLPLSVETNREKRENHFHFLGHHKIGEIKKTIKKQ
jgi:hypothetical protein